MNKLLKKYNQEHLKNIENLNNVDFKLMNKLYVNSYIDEKLNLKKVKPLKVIQDVKNQSFIKCGENIVLNNNYGIVLMAGGNATRLGLNKPKGMLEINYYNKKMSLFQIYINKVSEVYNQYKVYINIYIMTNKDNKDEIMNFFEENNYFNYPKDKIKFFIQGMLPLLSVDGKILLKDKNNIWLVPNGNGDVFKSLKNSELINDMKANNIKYCLFTGIDNPLIDLVDFNFLGSTIFYKYKLSSKTIYKSNALEKDWVFCKYNNRPYMLDDNHIKYFNDIKDENNDYLYREKNIMYHLIHIDYIEKFSKINLKYHRAYKKYDAYEDNRLKTINCFKFEKFIYDAFYYAKDMLLYRVNEDEFYPIKKKEDIECVEKILNHNK